MAPSKRRQWKRKKRKEMCVSVYLATTKRLTSATRKLVVEGMKKKICKLEKGDGSWSTHFKRSMGEK